MKVLIIGGFLGSGKTSMLLQLARYIVETSTSDSEYKVAIVENEIGEVGVDDVALRGLGLQVENLFAGCACCTMSGEVPNTIDKIRKELNPEWVILESTGVAYPLSIKETLFEALGIDSIIVGVVDAKRWHRLLIPMSQLLEGQLSDANSILINKIDLVDAETLESVMTSVREYNANAPLLPVCAEVKIDTAVWDTVLGR